MDLRAFRGFAAVGAQGSATTSPPLLGRIMQDAEMIRTAIGLSLRIFLRSLDPTTINYLP